MVNLKHESEEFCGNCNIIYTTKESPGKCPNCGYVEPACSACANVGKFDSCETCENGSNFKEAM